MKSYWNNDGKFQKFATALRAFVPVEGPVTGDQPKLEKFRVASNCYYDLFNNGLCNRVTEFRLVFGFGGSNFGRDIGGPETPEMKAFLRKVETKMDEIILAAAVEQKVD